LTRSEKIDKFYIFRGNFPNPNSNYRWLTRPNPRHKKLTRPRSKNFDSDPSLVWFEFTKWSYKTKFNLIHYRFIRSACLGYQWKLSKPDLTDWCKRSFPTKWIQFITASSVIKTFRDCSLKPLLDLLSIMYHEEPRKPGLGRFFDNS